MTLIEGLRQIVEKNPNTVVYLGTSGGSKWMAIDFAPNVIQVLPSLGEKARMDFALMTRREEKAVADLTEAVKKGHGKEVVLERDKKRLKDHQTYLQKWQGLESRNIVETRTHETEPRGISILIEGSESGEFWSWEEARDAESGKKIEKD